MEDYGRAWDYGASRAMSRHRGTKRIESESTDGVKMSGFTLGGLRGIMKRSLLTANLLD